MVYSCVSLASVVVSLLALSEAKAISTTSSCVSKTGHDTTKAATTFSIPTASSAPSTASLPTVDNGKEYINYTNVGGFFLQDLNTTVPSTFDYVRSVRTQHKYWVLIYSRLPPTLV